MVSHKATYLNVRKLGSCNCSSWKLLAVINMTRPECSVVAPGHTLAYAAVRYLSRVRNLDRLSPKTQLFKLSGSNRESSRKMHNFSDASWTRFAVYLETNCNGKKAVSFSFIFYIFNVFHVPPEKYIFRLAREIYCRAMKIQRNLTTKDSQERGFLCCYIVLCR